MTAHFDSKHGSPAGRMRIAISSNTAWSIFNFREGLIRHLVAKGFDVVTIAPPDDFSARLASLGCQVIDQPMDNKGTNPLRDLVLCYSFLRLFRKLQPAVVINFTIKPVIYGGLAAKFLKIPYVSVVTGLGSVFTEENWITRVVEYLYRGTQTAARCVFFLNEDDQQIFLDRGLVSNQSKYKVLPGSGVNLDFFSTQVLPSEGVNLNYFSPLPYQSRPRDIVFLLPARMILEKGISIFVDAARIVKSKHPDVRFHLLGPMGVPNRSAVDKHQMDTWVKEGIVEYLGNTNDVRPYISNCDCVVLPSYYREGVPRSLLEAAAMGRPIITTNSVGCRNVVDDGISGYLCEPRSVRSLADRMLRFLELSREEVVAMGAAGRAKIEREFDEQIVIESYMTVIEKAIIPVSASESKTEMI